MPSGPWASLPERIVTDRIDALMRADPETLRALRPPIPNIGKIAPRFGISRRAISAADVIKPDRYPGPKADPLSARPGYSGSQVPGFSSG